MYKLLKYSSCRDRWVDWGVMSLRDIQKYTRHDRPRLDGVEFDTSSGWWKVTKVS